VVLPCVPCHSQAARGVDDRHGGEADGAVFPDDRGAPGCGAAWRDRLERGVSSGVQFIDLI